MRGNGDLYSRGFRRMNEQFILDTINRLLKKGPVCIDLLERELAPRLSSQCVADCLEMLQKLHTYEVKTIDGKLHVLKVDPAIVRTSN
jgi:hypothetical protein